jgi:hypothetical protein
MATGMASVAGLACRSPAGPAPRGRSHVVGIRRVPRRRHATVRVRTPPRSAASHTAGVVLRWPVEEAGFHEPRQHVDDLVVREADQQERAPGSKVLGKRRQNRLVGDTGHADRLGDDRGNQAVIVEVGEAAGEGAVRPFLARHPLGPASGNGSCPCMAAARVGFGQSMLTSTVPSLRSDSTYR